MANHFGCHAVAIRSDSHTIATSFMRWNQWGNGSTALGCHFHDSQPNDGFWCNSYDIPFHSIIRLCFRFFRFVINESICLFIALLYRADSYAQLRALSSLLTLVCNFHSPIIVNGANPWNYYDMVYEENEENSHSNPNRFPLEKTSALSLVSTFDPIISIHLNY